MKISYRFVFSAFTASGLFLSGNASFFSTPFAFIPQAQAQTQVQNSTQPYNNAQLKDWLQKTGNEMVAIVNADISRQEQKEKFLPILNKYVDVDGIAKFCLGRFWRTATPQEQQEYTHLFHQVLVNAITNRLGDYKGVSFTIGDVTPMEGNRKGILTTLSRPKQPEVAIQWILEFKDGTPKVIDIIGENASLAVTQRGDYTSFIARHENKVSTLIDALKHQIANHS